MDTHRRTLRIAVIGAGIAGLTAAIAFRKEGHAVEVFESSALNKEIGAALSLTSNALRALSYLGFNINNLRAGDYRGVMWFDSRGGEGKFAKMHDLRNSFDPPGILCHRSDLHDELKRLAGKDEGAGKPVTINLNCEVASCDPMAGTFTLKNGDVHHADLIIGADGIHSKIRTSVLGYQQTALPSSRAAFRCLVDTAKLQGRAEFDWIRLGEPGPRGVTAQDGSKRYLIIYPCRDDTLVNIVAHYPDLREQDKFDWNALVTKEELVEKFKDFAPQFAGLLALADAPVHLWQIRALPCLPTWIRGRAALAGDAAHATFPTMGQGAGIAIEDAVALACLMPPGTAADEVPARLVAYQTLRKERGEFILTESVEQVTIPAKQGLYSRSQEMQEYIMGHDAVVEAQEYLAAHFSKLEN
ncbi:FAD/NAD(P)-binding domain-containing protein [Mycena pura]|uniref:FAD/NAD(P)-binding domain-containing protein n=1 Tax=Mycena pura TaxID=153505 RepID=A0AAD6Y2E2_9AGAR|nr:FAD/NAD(P)-binding domain-containing protein [Mycena pura]